MADSSRLVLGQPGIGERPLEQPVRAASLGMSAGHQDHSTGAPALDPQAVNCRRAGRRRSKGLLHGHRGSSPTIAGNIKFSALFLHKREAARETEKAPRRRSRGPAGQNDAWSVSAAGGRR